MIETFSHQRSREPRKGKIRYKVICDTCAREAHHEDMGWDSLITTIRSNGWKNVCVSGDQDEDVWYNFCSSACKDSFESKRGM